MNDANSLPICDDSVHNLPAVAYDKLSLDDVVTLRGLRTSQLNGKPGSVVSYDATSETIGVKLTACGSFKSEEVANLIKYNSSTTPQNLPLMRRKHCTAFHLVPVLVVHLQLDHLNRLFGLISHCQTVSRLRRYIQIYIYPYVYTYDIYIYICVVS